MTTAASRVTGATGDLAAAFASLSTPLVADACLRAKVSLRMGPPDLRPLVAGTRLAGHAVPARHHGSIDVFLEALGAASPGGILVVDNGGRTDEACIGDLTVLELDAAGLAGVVVWGRHRDSPELRAIGFPVFSCGTCPAGPRELRPRESDALQRAWLGEHSVSAEDAVFADDDGVVVVPLARVNDVLRTAAGIFETERRQADRVRQGRTLREQFAFDDYLARRAADPENTLRRHLRERGGEVEE